MSREKLDEKMEGRSEEQGDGEAAERAPAKGAAGGGGDGDDLGPLPPKWERALTESGEVYFIDHSSGTSHWLDPRLSKFQKKSLEDCLDDELPYGWEKICDPQYGTYFIDHVNRRTQYENPVIQAKRSARAAARTAFTRDPEELQGQRISTALLKSSRGLGFTIVGGDDDAEEFLQIKSVVPNGPAWLDGKLQTGDLIVFVNGACVLGYTHHQIVRMFQSISAGEMVALEVCRGYPLPFDPDDPNTEVVTTIAVDDNTNAASNAAANVAAANVASSRDCNLNLDDTRNFNFLDNTKGEASILSNSSDGTSDKIVRVAIVKGTLGFGFTIADSACGQRVKKILDRQRCKSLQEGDVLLEINVVSVQDMSHENVVQVLKNCPYNEEAVICVQRGAVPPKASNVSNASSSTNINISNNNNSIRGKNRNSGQYRSKTPTADLYSTQQKEVLPSRPKTPLVDTRVVVAKAPLVDPIIGQQYAHSETSCSQTDIGRPPFEYTRWNPGHVEPCFCYDCKQAKYVGVPHADAAPYDAVEYTTRNLDRRKELRDSWQWIYNGGQQQQHHLHQPPPPPPPPPPHAQQHVSPDCVESLVTLVRLESGFGFRIVGGTEEGSQVAVGHIVPGGSADLDGRIHSADEILSVDGHSVVKASHHQVVQLMGSAAARGKVTLRLRRRVVPALRSAPTYDVVVSRNESEGFGFVIISSVNRVGSTIGRLIEGSPAERCGQLHVGDHILAVNHFDITSLSHGDIVNLIKDSGYSVTLTIALPQINDLNVVA